MTTLIDRLRQDLPGEWRDLDALPGGAEFAWSERAIGDLDPCPVGGEIVDYEANVCSCGRIGGVTL